MIRILFLTLLYIPFSIFAQTPPVVYVSGNGSGDFNCNGVSDQIEINQALDYVANNPGFTTVYLKGANTYIIDEPVLISDNTILTGDSTATIKLVDNAAWWTYDKPMISQTGRIGWDPYGDTTELISNVEIYGFAIDAGRLQLEPSGDRYNTIIHFTFPNNIKIHDMSFTNGQWDAIRLSSKGWSNINCKVYDNIIRTCGHDAISFVGVKNFEASGNRIFKTRTNSGIRATECDSFYIHNNIIGNSIATPPSGYAGIQVQNQSFPCNLGEIYENVIYGKSEGIHLGEETNVTLYPTGMMKNIHIHHNKIYKTNNVTTGGTGVNLTGGIVVMGYQNTLIEHNIIDGGATDGISYRGNTGGGTGYQTIVRNNIIINNQGYGIHNESPSVNTFIADNNLVYNNTAGNYNNMSSNNDVNSAPLFGENHSTLNQWHHIVASYDNTSETMKIFINGIEKSSANHTGLFGTIGTNAYNLLLGVFYNSNYWFEGKQDELGLWNRALTELEISTLYNNGNPLTYTGSLTNGLQAYLKMDNNWNDASGNGFNAEDSTATFTSNAINGVASGLFDGIDDGVQYPTALATTNGLSISVWVYRTSLAEEIQTIVNKGKPNDFDHIWLYFRGESVLFELGNGTTRTDIEAYITNPEDLDYHVKSEYGRWQNNTWTLDGVTSPCVDGGYTSSVFTNEPFNNGAIVNIGVYGNTVQASKSDPSTNIVNSQKNYIDVFPNPTTGKVFITNTNANFTFQLRMLSGKLVKEGGLKTNFIDVSEFNNGIYLIELTNQITNEKSVIKIVKQ